MSSPGKLLRGRSTSADLLALDVPPPIDHDLQYTMSSQSMRGGDVNAQQQKLLMKGQPILAGSTVFLTANVLK
ncbi:hypothetical protein TrLO_g13236 [Triparma laevis f. longispina]|uniref:Uncharacterized protein n=1 Tax=Triparma laevis f. longispina TaxID=1714387 RepID=A0A9W7F8U4_9STRA|nr:hypothetical protein TrLO_g13236 [Triparma laevis f. longispina]